MNSFAANKYSKEKFPNCKENRHTSLQIKTKLECLVINVSPNSPQLEWLHCRDSGRGRLPPTKSPPLQNTCCQAARQRLGQDATYRETLVRSLLHFGLEGKKSYLAVTEYLRVTYSKPTFCESPRKQANSLCTWSPWAPQCLAVTLSCDCSPWWAASISWAKQMTPRLSHGY